MITFHCNKFNATSREFRLCDCNYEKPKLLNELNKLNFNFYTFGCALIPIHLLSFRREAFFGHCWHVCFTISPTQGVCPYLTVLA